MADEIIIDVQVNTDEVQKKLSDAIAELGKLKSEQNELTKSIKAGNDANGEQAKQLASVQAEMQKQQAVIKSSTAALQVSNKTIDTQNMTLDEQRQLLGQLQKRMAVLRLSKRKARRRANYCPNR